MSEGLDADGFYYDGRSNRRRSVHLSLGNGLKIEEVGAPALIWPFDSLRLAHGPADEMRISSTAAEELARVVFTDATFGDRLASVCPQLLARGAQASGNLRIVAWSAAAIASIVLTMLFGVPYLADRLAPLVPPSIENRLGDMVDGQIKQMFGAKVCAGASGRAALDKLMVQLSRAAQVADVRAEVLQSPVKNAVALPGGRVYVFNALLQSAQAPDEIAGVIAHELGHVRHRDGMRRLIQTGGTSFLVGLLFGDVSGSGAAIFVTQELLSASYSRESEAQADTISAEAMHSLGRSARPMGELLMRITGKESESFEILASHPLTQERLAALGASDKGETGPPLLDFGEWRALRNICSDKD